MTSAPPQLRAVRTVLGPVRRQWSGPCLAHVHLLGGPVEAPPDGSADRDDLHLTDHAVAAGELARLRAAGAGAVVEMSCLDFNRSVTGLRDLSRSSGVDIVATTGFRSGASAHVAGWDADWAAIADRMRADVLVGEDGVRAGVLKGGSGRGGLTAHDHAVLRAAAVMQAETGLPVSTHSEAGELLLDQLRVLERYGADLRRVAIGHIDRRHDRNAHRQVLETGAFVLYDQIGKHKYHSDGDYAALLRWLDDAGFAHQLLLSSDFGRRSYFDAAGGSPGLAYLLTDFRDHVVRAGVRDDLITAALGENAWRFFSCPVPGGRTSP